MSKHPPEPWSAIPDSREDAEGHWYILTDDEDVIATGLIEQDAHLIAAAPDLLAALKGLVGLADEGAMFSERIEKARAAIAKAEGTS